MSRKMSDYIKREDAIEQARRNWTGEDDWIASTEINLLKNLPPADVRENVRGEWIDKPNREFCFRADFKSIECNQCGYNMPKSDSFASNYCPNCGADMRGDQT